MNGEYRSIGSNSRAHDGLEKQKNPSLRIFDGIVLQKMYRLVQIGNLGCTCGAIDPEVAVAKI